jgi:very-short-patch-repair endonuclease
VPAEVRERRLRDLAAGVIHSSHPPDELWSRAAFLDRTARTNLEEGGASTLYIAIGLLRWFETPQSTDARLAPLLLYPVTLSFDRQKRRIRMQRLDEDPLPNQTLIEKLRVDHQVDLSPLAAMEADESGIDVNLSLRRAREAVQQMPRWEVLEESHLALFSFTKFLMWKDLADNADALLTNPVVQHIADHQAGPGIVKAPDLAPESLDERDAAALPCVVDADSTQMLAIEAALSGGGLVLQEPPGTGKSQTITNLIAAALARNETVLFVSEKMAALEVVYRRLRDVELEEFCLELHSHKTTRRQVVESFGSVFRSLNEAAEPGAWERTTAELVTERRKLNEYVRVIHAPTALGETLYDVFGRLRQLHGAADLVLPFPDPMGLTPARLAEQRTAVDSFVRGAGAVEPIASNPWRWSEQTDWTDQRQQQLQDDLLILTATLPALEQGVAALAAGLGVAPPSSTDDVALLSDSAAAVERELDVLCREMEGGPVPRPALEAENWTQLADHASTFSAESRALQTSQRELATRWTDAFRTLDLSGLRAQFERAAKAFFLWAWLILWSARKVRQVAQKGLPSDAQILTDIDAVQQEPGRKDSLRALQHRVASSLPDIWSTSGGTPDALDDVVARGTRARAARERLKALEHGARIAATAPATWRRSHRQLAAQRATLEPLLARLLEAETAIRYATGASSVPWPASSTPEHRFQLGLWAATLTEALHGFRAWCLYQKYAAGLRALGLTSVVQAHVAGNLTSDEVLAAWEKGVLSRWFRAAVDREPILREFEGAAHDQLVERFAHLDREHVTRARRWIAAQLRRRVPALDSAPRGSELFVLRREIEKKARHLPVRKLLAAITSVRPRLKPCLMMSPLSVAQYLPPSTDFDVVVFDEASQIETHDAIGAIARGRKVVIVGDSKQLPPTRFFSRTSDDQEAPVDENDVTELDSVLDEAKAKNLPERTLGWHYRSRHDALIEFSNAHYYENRLQVFPAARRNVLDLGISWHPVTDGVFLSGGSRAEARTNPIEARALVAHLVEALEQHTPGGRTFGVVTFSLTQKELIESLLDKARVERPAIEGHFTGPESVFVKNLENVQGDERDEILFSIAYAKNETGSLRHHFGPLSNSGGERRLNVAITRARRQLRVFSTLTHEQIDVGRTHAVGAAHLRAFLKFAAERGRATPDASTAVRFRSALERELHDVLTREGYLVDTQVGCGSYVLDLAVRHPAQSGVYALGIETDGPMYHLAKTARDRDRLRLQVLADLGWSVHRVWTMEWHHRRSREVERLLQAAREACATETPTATRVSREVTPRVPSQGAEGVPPPLPIRPSERRAAAAGSPYRRARLDPITTADLYENHAALHIRTILKKLIEVEAPIHRAVAAKRIVECWGMTKLTQKAESRVRDVADDMSRGEALAVVGDYYWRQSEEVAAYRDFRTSGDGPDAREAHQIAPEELANAFAHVLEQVGSMDVEGLIREAARLSAARDRHLREAPVLPMRARTRRHRHRTR